MRAWRVVVIWALAWGVGSPDCFAQTNDKAALQKERDRITQQLKTTENLLNQAKRNRNDAAQQVVCSTRKLSCARSLCGTTRRRFGLWNAPCVAPTRSSERSKAMCRP